MLVKPSFFSIDILLVTIYYYLLICNFYVSGWISSYFVVALSYTFLFVNIISVGSRLYRDLIIYSEIIKSIQLSSNRTLYERL